MPIWWGLAGTAIAERTETAELSGTATVDADPEYYLAGTAIVDRSSVMAWAARRRWGATRVLLGDEAEDMVRVQGDVQISRDAASPVATASFQLTDDRCAYFAPDSVATGGIPVTIRVRLETETAKADTQVFKGLTEAAPNEGAYVPTAMIQCGGEGSEWLVPGVCLDIPAFAGMTRLDAFKEAARSMGVDPARIIGGEEWRLFRLPLRVSGISLWELGQRFARMEDCFLRTVDGNLEILPARKVVGPGAAPVFDFTGDNYSSDAETPPNRPTERRVLSTIGLPEGAVSAGTEIVTPELYYGTTSAGVYWERRIVTTTVNGVLIRQRAEEWRDAAIPGETPGPTAFRLWRLTETEKVWGTTTVEGVSLRTSRLVSEDTTVHEFFSPPCRTADGYVWAGGLGRRVDATATWQITERDVTTYAYGAAPECILEAKTTRRGRWYSELASGGETYDDGSVRADAAYQWTSETATPPHELVEEVNTEEATAEFTAIETAVVTSGWNGTPDESWGEKSGSNTRWSTVPGSGMVTEATFEFRADGSSEGNAKTYAGELPALPRAAVDIPQYRTVPVVLDVQNDDASLATELKTEPVWGAEDMQDLVNVARHDGRDERSPSVTISHRANPFLLLYHPVTADDPTRSIVAKPGYVRQVQMTLNASTTGAMSQQTIVVFPLPQYDPGVEVFAA